jgi:hypothetical protein
VVSREGITEQTAITTGRYLGMESLLRNRRETSVASLLNTSACRLKQSFVA